MLPLHHHPAQQSFACGQEWRRVRSRRVTEAWGCSRIGVTLPSQGHEGSVGRAEWQHRQQKPRGRQRRQGCPATHRGAAPSHPIPHSPMPSLRRRCGTGSGGFAGRPTLPLYRAQGVRWGRLAQTTALALQLSPGLEIYGLFSLHP